MMMSGSDIEIRKLSVTKRNSLTIAKKNFESIPFQDRDEDHSAVPL